MAFAASFGKNERLDKMLRLGCKKEKERWGERGCCQGGMRGQVKGVCLQNGRRGGGVPALSLVPPGVEERAMHFYHTKHTQGRRTSYRREEARSRQCGIGS